MGKKPSSGRTAMAHAMAWQQANYPGALVIKAQKNVKWLGPNRQITVSEDVWGVFDLMVFPLFGNAPIDRNLFVECVQVTTCRTKTEAGPAVADRKRKVGRWILEHWSAGRPWWLGTVSLMGWVPRHHFRRWVWNWSSSAWREEPPVPAPLPRKARTTPEPPAEKTALPFD